MDRAYEFIYEYYDELKKYSSENETENQYSIGKKYFPTAIKD